jgi:hypothetical protein
VLSTIGTGIAIHTIGRGAGGSVRSEGTASESCRPSQLRLHENAPNLSDESVATVTPYTASMMFVRCVLPRPVRQRSRDRESALA